MTFGTLPRLHFMQRDHAVPRLLERCRDISLPLVSNLLDLSTCVETSSYLYLSVSLGACLAVYLSIPLTLTLSFDLLEVHYQLVDRRRLEQACDGDACANLLLRILELKAASRMRGASGL